ncbi:MAG: hypothetical protein AAF125_22870, partial [Chloroflexota bacterium]
QPVEVAPTAVPVFCDGAMFERYIVGAQLTVTFEDDGALRLLDRPRLPGRPEPVSQKLLYDGWAVEILGEPECGAWRGEPLVYWPVYSPSWDMEGWVGFGQGGDVWLQN